MNRLLVALCFAATVSPRPARAQACKPNLTPSFEFQVQRPARFIGDTVARPRPAVQHSSASETLVVQFIVDTLGLVREGTLRVLKTPSPEVSAAVSAAYASWKYMPAMTQGCKVVQLVQTEVER
jgi:hypothetical protein